MEEKTSRRKEIIMEVLMDNPTASDEELAEALAKHGIVGKQ